MATPLAEQKVTTSLGQQSLYRGGPGGGGTGDALVYLHSAAGEIPGAAVVQQKEALADPPQRRRAELIAARLTLGDTVGEPRPDVVKLEIAERGIGDIALSGEDRSRRGA